MEKEKRELSGRKFGQRFYTDRLKFWINNGGDLVAVAGVTFVAAAVLLSSCDIKAANTGLVIHNPPTPDSSTRPVQGVNSRLIDVTTECDEGEPVIRVQDWALESGYSSGKVDVLMAEEEGSRRFIVVDTLNGSLRTYRQVINPSARYTDTPVSFTIRKGKVVIWSVWQSRMDIVDRGGGLRWDVRLEELKEKVKVKISC